MQSVLVIVSSQPALSNVSFSYIPQVVSINPSSGPTRGGTIVSIQGSGFGNLATAILGTYFASPLSLPPPLRSPSSPQNHAQ